jgi:hypothetical protein
MKIFYNAIDLVFEEKPKNPCFKDLTGQEFDRWKVIDYAGSYKWFCRCQCGNIKKVHATHLNGGKSKSCGCFNAERTRERSTTHGHANRGRASRTYKTWENMKNRCDNPNYFRYADYGGRGIKYCERWMRFDNFLEDMGERPDGMCIERIKNDLGYFKENCRWATQKEQHRNKRSNVCLTFEGKTQTVAQWTEELGFKRATIYARISKGWTVQRALTSQV